MHARAHLDVDRHRLGAGGEHVVEFTVEDLDQVVGRVRERVVAIARARELQHQVLVVAKPEADGADRDSLAQELAAQSCKVGWISRPNIGLAVREQHDAIEPPGVLGLADLACALHHSVVDGRAATYTNLADAIGEHGAVVDRLRRDQDVDLVVEDDDRGDVVLIEPVDRHDGGLARLCDTGATHRAGSIDHERHVDGRAVVAALGLAAVERDAQVVLLGLAGFHHRLRKPRFKRDWLVGSGCTKRKQSGRKQNSEQR